MRRGRAPVSRLLAGDQGDGEHRQRQRSQRQAGLHGVVLEGHLEEEREDDHRAAEGDLLQHLALDTRGEVRGLEETGVEQGDLATPLAAGEPPGERAERDGADRHEEQDELAAFLPHEDAEHDSAHAHDREGCPDEVDRARAGVGDVLHQPDLAEDHCDDDDLESEADAP